MLDLELTNQQRQYLLYLIETDKKETLTTVAKHFACSKVNSKKILDRMIKIGIIYKENNRIILTDIGYQLAAHQRETRDEIALVLEEGLSIDVIKAKELAATMLVEESTGIRLHLLDVAKHFRKLGSCQGAKISSEDMINILGKGKFKVYFAIFQEECHKEHSSNPLSMAMRGFHEDALIEVSEDFKATLSLRSRPLDKEHHGVKFTGKPKIVAYRIEGKEICVPVGETCILPFELFQAWYYTGGGMLQSCVCLDMIPNIDIAHKHIAKFVFTINLFSL